jgi:hypothetical protein
MKKIIAGLAMVAVFSGVVSIPAMAHVAEDSPACAVFKAIPPLPVGPPSRCS